MLTAMTKENATKKHALVLGGGIIDNYEAVRQRLGSHAFDLVICADSGLIHAAPLGQTVTHVVGDFDSVQGDWKAMAPAAEVHSFPAAKDATDLQLALDLAVTNGATTAVIAGGTGGRLDHLLGNVLLLPSYTARGLALRLVDAWSEGWVAPPICRFATAAGQLVSLIPLTPAVSGVTTRGLEYGLTNAELSWGSTRGISNVALGSEAEVRHSAGTLLIVLAND